MTSAARVAADVAALLPLNDPLGRLARRRLALAVREEHTTVTFPQPDIDPRDVPPPVDVSIKIGTPLRDAAVDPLPGDHLAPSNAGEPGALGNPHGPNVVSPEVPGA